MYAKHHIQALMLFAKISRVAHLWFEELRLCRLADLDRMYRPVNSHSERRFGQERSEHASAAETQCMPRTCINVPLVAGLPAHLART